MTQSSSSPACRCSRRPFRCRQPRSSRGTCWSSCGISRRQRKLYCRADRFGNLLVARSKTLPRRPIIIVAHADHPGFIARQMLDGHTGQGRRGTSSKRQLLADWHGGVEAEYFVGSRVRFHPTLDRSVTGTIRQIADIDTTDNRQRVQKVVLEVGGDVPAGSPGTWDVPVFQLKGRTVRRRAYRRRRRTGGGPGGAGSAHPARHTTSAQPCWSREPKRWA